MTVTGYALSEPRAGAMQRGAVTRMLEDERWLAACAAAADAGVVGTVHLSHQGPADRRHLLLAARKS